MSVKSIRIAKLGEISEITMGNSPPGESYNSNGVGTPLVNGPVEFGDGALGRTVKSKWTTDPSKFCGEGDLLICVRGSTTGRTNVAGFDACIGRGVASIRAYEHQGYLNRFLTTRRREIFNSGKGSTFPSISRDQIASIEIPLPPLAEQKRIAGILDAADALRAKRRDALAQLDTLLQATFLDLFGDPVTDANVADAVMTDVVTRFIDYRGKSPIKVASGVPLITAKVVKNMTVLEPDEFIAATSYDSWMRRGIPRPGDVIITTEAPMGEVALVPKYKAAFAQRLLVLQPNLSKVTSTYLMWALTMPFAVRQMDRRSTGSTVTGIRSKEFKKVRLPLPELSKQKHFGGIVFSIEQQKSNQQQHLAELDTLFASLQSRAFRGEL